MKKLNQMGVIGAAELGAFLVLAGMVGFVGFRIASVNSDINQNNESTLESSESSLVDTIKANQEDSEEKKKVDIPKEEDKVKEVEPEPVKKDLVKDDDSKDDDDDKDDDKKKDITYVSFSSNTASLSGTTISARAELKSRQTGTCFMKMYKDGERVIHEVKLKNEKVCETTFDTSELSEDGDWELHSWFNSDDGKTEGYAEEFDIEI